MNLLLLMTVLKPIPPHVSGDSTPKKKPTANLDKAKSRFRTAAWWCFGIAVGLIGGKIYADLAIYFGMPAAIPSGPMEVWVIGTWTAVMAFYVFFYSGIWIAATAIRRKLSVRTAYDINVGDVRIIKVAPEITPLLDYKEEPLQIEETAQTTKEAT